MAFGYPHSAAAAAIRHLDEVRRVSLLFLCLPTDCPCGSAAGRAFLLHSHSASGEAEQFGRRSYRHIYERLIGRNG